MEECFEARALGWGVEDDGGDQLAINRRGCAVDFSVAAMAIANAVAPPREELATDDGIVVRVVCEIIAVGDDAAERGKDARNGGLPRAGCAGEAEGWGVAEVDVTISHRN